MREVEPATILGVVGVPPAGDKATFYVASREFGEEAVDCFGEELITIVNPDGSIDL